VSRARCKGGRAVNVALAHVTRGGGEGIILRKVKSLYEHGRSPNLFKLKVYSFLFYTFLFHLVTIVQAYRADLEALVMAHSSKWAILQLYVNIILKKIKFYKLNIIF
jgi:ATP-dependent DNA ligase